MESMRASAVQALVENLASAPFRNVSLYYQICLPDKGMPHSVVGAWQRDEAQCAPVES